MISRYFFSLKIHKHVDKIHLYILTPTPNDNVQPTFTFIRLNAME